MTLSVGVPRTAKARSSTLRMRKGSCRESEWLAPDWLLSGATTQTSSLNLEAGSPRSACRAGRVDAVVVRQEDAQMQGGNLSVISRYADARP